MFQVKIEFLLFLLVKFDVFSNAKHFFPKVGLKARKIFPIMSNLHLAGAPVLIFTYSSIQASPLKVQPLWKAGVRGELSTLILLSMVHGKKSL